MSSVAYRGLRLALGSLFVLGAALVVAPNANAQFTSGDACIWPSDVPSLFFIGPYSGVDNCEGICKKSASVCRRLVRDAGKCWQGENSGVYAIYSSGTCKNLEDPADQKECNEFSNTERRNVKEDISLAVDSGIEGCNSYQNNCVANCGEIPE